MWFAPQGVALSDGSTCVRPVENLRNIYGGSSDSKLIAGAVSHKMVAPTLKITPAMQRGFCKGGQLSLNTVDLDLYMRVFNCKYESGEGGLLDVSKLPALSRYDFPSAFPIV